MSLYDVVVQSVNAGMCQEAFQANPDAGIEFINSRTNEELLRLISDALENADVA